MVDDDAFIAKQKAEALAFETLLTIANNEIDVLENTNEQSEVLKQQKEIAVRNVNWYSAQYQFHDKNTLYTGNFVWNPYPVQWLDCGQFADRSIVELLDKDHTGVAGL
eukprot:2354108-Prymnesium_polylepis.1